MPKTFVLGRDASADIAIGDPSVSRRHAELVLLDDQRLFVRDLGGANGTVLIRGGTRTPLEREVLTDGDEVQFGDVALTFGALREILFEKLGRTPSPHVDDAHADRGGRDEAHHNCDHNRGHDGGRDQHRGDGGVLPRRDVPDPDRSRRPTVFDFVPTGGFQLLKDRGLLLPAIVFAVLLLRLMWLGRQNTDEAVASFLTTFTAALATAGFIVVYRLCGKRKPIKIILIVMAVEAAVFSMHDVIRKPFCEATGADTILLRNDVATGRIKIKRNPQPQSQPKESIREGPDPQPPAPEGAAPAGAAPTAPAQAGEYIVIPPPSFLSLFWAYFTCAGMLEELEKMIPVLGLIWLTTSAMRRRSESALGADTGRWGVFEPLDAIVYASAAALTFILLETLFSTHYVGKALINARAQGHLGVTAYMSFPIAIIRTMKGIAGHIAYSGYFAYFIGLGLLRPKHRERLWIGGWIGAAFVHGLFNASPSGLSPFFAVAAFFLLLAAILKARQISPTRDENFATRAVPRSKLT